MVAPDWGEPVHSSLKMVIYVATRLILSLICGRLLLSPNCSDVSEEKFRGRLLLEKFIGME